MAEARREKPRGSPRVRTGARARRRGRGPRSHRGGRRPRSQRCRWSPTQCRRPRPRTFQSAPSPGAPAGRRSAAEAQTRAGGRGREHGRGAGTARGGPGGAGPVRAPVCPTPARTGHAARGTHHLVVQQGQVQGKVVGRQLHERLDEDLGDRVDVGLRRVELVAVCPHARTRSTRVVVSPPRPTDPRAVADPAPTEPDAACMCRSTYSLSSARLASRLYVPWAHCWSTKASSGFTLDGLYRSMPTSMAAMAGSTSATPVMIARSSVREPVDDDPGLRSH